MNDSFIEPDAVAAAAAKKAKVKMFQCTLILYRYVVVVG
jgi:hypothetical protein